MAKPWPKKGYYKTWKLFQLEEYREILDKIKPKDGSGVQDFDKAVFEKLKKNKNKANEELIEDLNDPVLKKLIKYFSEASYSELLDYLYEDPSRISSNEIKAIKFLAEVKLGFKPNTTSLIRRDNFYDYKKTLSFSDALIEIAQNLNLKDIDFFQYQKNIPQLSYFWIKAQVFNIRDHIPNNVLESFIERIDLAFQDLKDLYENDSEVISHFEERVFYLKGLLFKKLGKIEEATLYINKYLEKSLTLEEKISNLILLANQEVFIGDEVLSNMKITYGEVSEISSFISDTSLLTQDTCGSYSCDDCCKYTYPSLSLTEFEYIKSWAIENDFDFSKAIEKSKLIQDAYKKKTNKLFKIENKIDGLDLNPEDYKFDCPFLDEGRCSIHPARPLLCRVFGSGATDPKFLKSCNYYLNQYQHMSSPENERLAYDARGFQASLDESDKYLSQGDFAKTGLIPAFLMDLDENLD